MDNLFAATCTLLAWILRTVQITSGYPAPLCFITGWPACSGITGRIRLEWVADLEWNQWPACNGMGGQFGLEYAADVIDILEESGLGLPSYYSWRSRSGCYFCFFQRRNEWVGLYDSHPELFEKALEYESNHADGRTYTWIEGESLKELLDRRDTILADANSKAAKRPSKKLYDRLQSLKFSVGQKSVLKGTSVAVDPEENEPCLICTL